MALNFTDSQIESITTEMLNIPQALASLNSDLAKVAIQRDKTLEKDAENTVFFGNYKGNIDAYHTELSNLDGTQKTEYPIAEVDLGARKDQNSRHYPITPVAWINMNPKMLDENIGNPLSTVDIHEEIYMYKIQETKSELVSGFAGSGSDTTMDSYSVGDPTIKVESGGQFTIGQKIVVDGGSYSMLAIIDTITAEPPADPPAEPPEPTGEILGITVLAAPSGTISQNSTVVGSLSGWNETDRISGNGPLQDILTYYRSKLDSDVLTWGDVLLAESDALSNNDSSKSDIEGAFNDITLSLGVISDWMSLLGDRYSDSGLSDLQSEMDSRVPKIVSRIAAINTALGALTQNPDGTSTGGGEYFEMFKWLDLRINIAGGSLSSYYGLGMAEGVFEQQISQTETKEAEYNSVFNLELFTRDGDGTATIGVVDSSGFSIGDEVKIIANGQVVLTYIIIDVVANEIELDGIVSSDYALGGQARAVKRL